MSPFDPHRKCSNREPTTLANPRRGGLHGRNDGLTVYNLISMSFRRVTRFVDSFRVSSIFQDDDDDDDDAHRATFPDEKKKKIKKRKKEGKRGCAHSS